MRSSLVILILLCTVNLSAQSLARDQMRADYDVLISALKEAHGGLYRYTKSAELDDWLKACREKIPASASKTEFGTFLREAMAPIRDGHNRLAYDDQTSSRLNEARLLPLRLLIEGERLMVLFNDSRNDQHIKPGMEVISINGHLSRELVSQMLKRMPVDGFIETGRRRVLERTFHSQYWLQVEQPSRFDLICRTPEGTEFVATLEGVTNADRLTFRNANPVNAEALKKVYLPGTQSDNIMLSFSDGNKIAHLRIRGFEGGDYTAQLDGALAEIKAKGSTGMILDLRGNGGGVDMDGAYLVSQFASKPFRYFDHINIKTINPSFTTWRSDTYADLKEGTVANEKGGYLVLPRLHPGVAEQPPASKPFTGKLVVLIDGNTFSTAADVCAVLRGLDRAYFIGEETGGAAEGNTSGLNAMVKLPNSGHKLQVQMYGYWNAVKAMPGRGTLPDAVVERSAADLLKGLDRQRERGMQWLISTN